MSFDVTLLDNLQSRLTNDGVIAGLPRPGRVGVLIEIGQVRFLVGWDEGGFSVEPAIGINDSWDFSFSVPTGAWDEFSKVEPAPLNNTAQALVAQFGDKLISGNRIKWAQYAPLVERILFCLKPSVDRGQVPELPRKSAISATYLTIDYEGREYRIFYEEAGSGIPMLCLHTAGSDSRQYKYMLEDPELQADFRMIAFDMPWHGRSMPPRGWRHEQYQLDVQFYMGIVREFSKALGLDKPVLIGCSMGGAIAVVLAGVHGEEFRAICALEGTLGGNAHAPSRRGIWTRHMEVDHSMFLSTWVAGLMSPSSPQELQDDVLWEYAQGGPGVYNGDGAMVSSLQAIGPTLDSAKCPLYVFSGDYDYSATPAMSKQAADQLGGEFIQMIGKGHFPMAEDPIGFKTYLLPVLDKIKQLTPESSEVKESA
jgi:pimeloyl-ACP methyl ester carboxylesterase